jgi:hypothetical protein
MFLKKILFLSGLSGQSGNRRIRSSEIKSFECRGASILEMLFAVAVVSLAMPFAYRQISGVGENMKLMGAAQRLIADSDAVKNHMRLYAGDFPEGELAEIESDDEDKKVYVSNYGGGIEAFVVARAYRGDILKSHKIAGMIGMDAAVVEQDGTAYSGAGNWAAQLPDAAEGDIVYRIRSRARDDETAKYLHRTILSEGELSTMMRDLSMGNNSIFGANEVVAQKLASSGLDAHLAKTPVIAANSLYFSNGVNLNPDKSNIPNIRVNGDAIGFRNFYTDNFSSGGALTADRASVTKRLVVSKKFEVKAPSARTVSGFAGVSAGKVRTAYLDTTNLTFMPGFGLVVSSELLYSGTAPLKLGAWSFPNSSGAGPKFTSLKLSGARQISAAVPDFSEILKSGWR